MVWPLIVTGHGGGGQLTAYVAVLVYDTICAVTGVVDCDPCVVVPDDASIVGIKSFSKKSTSAFPTSCFMVHAEMASKSDSDVNASRRLHAT